MKKLLAQQTQNISTKATSLGTKTSSKPIILQKQQETSPKTSSPLYKKGDFQGITYKPNVCTSRGLQLPEHEVKHKKIMFVPKNEVFAIFTSSKKPQYKGAMHMKIDEVKVNGSFTPSKDDAYNSSDIVKQDLLTPSADKGGQYLAGLGTPRIITNEYISVDKEVTTYCEKHHEKMSVFYQKYNENKKNPIVNTHKDDSSLYTEDGRANFDENGNEIDYD